ncbi:MAG: polysaccharide deacetylase [Promethearchaeota archaeon]
MSNESVWPDGFKCCVVPTVDVDAESSSFIITQEDPTARPIMWSIGEFGPNEGYKRLLKIYKKYDLKATFFIPGWVAERHPDMVRDIYSEGHEIGNHGYTHELLHYMEFEEEEEKEIHTKSQAVFKDLIGEKPVGYRSPAWEFTPHTKKILLDLKYLYSSNYMNATLPYIHKKDGKDTGLVEIPVYWGCDDFPRYYIMSEQTMLLFSGSNIEPTSPWLEVVTEEFDAYYDEGLCYCAVVHPLITGRPSRARAYEKWIQHMVQRPGVWFATGKELAKYWLAKHKKK